MDSDDEEYFLYKKIKTKGKAKTYNVPVPEILELKLLTGRHGKCIGAALEAYENKSNEPQSYTSISNDIWFHLANYIAPEEVKNYSLICTQSAGSVNSRSFWMQLYKRYCQRGTSFTSKWVLGLPEELQITRLRDCDRNNLRHKVIQALYRCYPHFQKRLQSPYPLEILEGIIYISSWRKVVNSKQLVCYKFQRSFALNSAIKKSYASSSFCKKKFDVTDTIADNWEYLADETNNNYCKESQSCSTLPGNSQEAVFLLYIYCKRFPPLPIMCNHDTGPFRFVSSRILLSSDMKSEDLELNFISTINEHFVTVKYLKVLEFKVLPWWHPAFEKYL